MKRRRKKLKSAVRPDYTGLDKPSESSLCPKSEGKCRRVWSHLHLEPITLAKMWRMTGKCNFLYSNAKHFWTWRMTDVIIDFFLSSLPPGPEGCILLCWLDWVHTGTYTLLRKSHLLFGFKWVTWAVHLLSGRKILKRFPIIQPTSFYINTLCLVLF